MTEQNPEQLAVSSVDPRPHFLAKSKKKQVI